MGDGTLRASYDTVVSITHFLTVRLSIRFVCLFVCLPAHPRFVEKTAPVCRVVKTGKATDVGNAETTGAGLYLLCFVACYILTTFLFGAFSVGNNVCLSHVLSSVYLFVFPDSYENSMKNAHVRFLVYEIFKKRQ